MTLKVTHVDDRNENSKRGVGEVHYGFAYFNDERRVTYTNKGVGMGSGGWLPITPTHVRLAKQFLEAQGMLDSAYEPK